MILLRFVATVVVLNRGEFRPHRIDNRARRNAFVFVGFVGFSRLADAVTERGPVEYSVTLFSCLVIIVLTIASVTAAALIVVTFEFALCVESLPHTKAVLSSSTKIIPGDCSKIVRFRFSCFFI